MIKLFVTVAVYLIVIFGGSPLVQVICRKVNLPRIDKGGLKGAGRFIGYFERFLVLTFALLGSYEAIAFVFVGKSILRFTKREETEYYLLGTLVSISWSIFWAIILKIVLGRIAIFS